MDYSDYEEKKHRQFVRVLIAEIGMVLAVIAVVIVSILAAMGFFISNDGKLEQAGLMQLHSLPTGATVELDGETLFSRTNLSRTMSAGEHTLKLSRDGYDTWEKTITMSPGILMRLYYPRLFLQNRTAESVLTLPENLDFFLPSRDRNYIIYSETNSPIWHVLDLRNDTVRESTALDTTDLIAGTVETLTWSSDSNKILARTRVTTPAPADNSHTSAEPITTTEWVLIDLRNPKSSLNLSTTFGLDFTELAIVDSSASQLYALENHQLRLIDTNSGSISKVLLGNVLDFASFGTSVIYVTDAAGATSTASAQSYAIGTYRANEDGGTIIKTDIPSDATVRVALSRYYDEDYLCFTIDQQLSIFYGTLPHYQPSTANTAASTANIADAAGTANTTNTADTAYTSGDSGGNGTSGNSDNGDGANDTNSNNSATSATSAISLLPDLKPLLENASLSLVPTTLSLSPDGEYLVAINGATFMVTDLDNGAIFEYAAPGASRTARWLDASMFYTIFDQELIVWDFDGTNVRTLADGVTDRSVLISSDNRWLYYLTTQDNIATHDSVDTANSANSDSSPNPATALTLVREKIRD